MLHHQLSAHGPTPIWLPPSVLLSTFSPTINCGLSVGFFAPCSAWLVVVVPLPTTLLLYPLSTTSDKCGCGRWHLCYLLSLVINFLSDWPTGSCHLVNTLASLYITLVGRTIPAPRPFGPETSQQYNHNSNAYPSFRLSVYFTCCLSCNIYLASPRLTSINEQYNNNTFNFRFRCY